MLQANPVRRWEQSDDLLQQALVRLDRSLERSRPPNARSLLQLAALEMRHALIDLARHYFGPCGPGAQYHSQAAAAGSTNHLDGFAGMLTRPDDAAARAELLERLYAAIDKLPDDEREVVDIIGIHELSQAEAAAILGVALKTIGRRWRRARLRLFEMLRETPSQV
jgi:RNA polymerase sigma-70 factor (ECF subfamily)